MMKKMGKEPELSIPHNGQASIPAKKQPDKGKGPDMAKGRDLRAGK